MSMNQPSEQGKIYAVLRLCRHLLEVVVPQALADFLVLRKEEVSESIDQSVVGAMQDV